MNRRQFLSRSAIGGVGVIAIPAGIAAGTAADAAPARPAVVALSSYTHFVPHEGMRSTDSAAWTVIDLGSRRTVHAIRFHAAVRGDCDTAIFDVECSDDPAFVERTPFLEWRAEARDDAANAIAHFPSTPVVTRYLRLAARGGDRLRSGEIEILSDRDLLRVAIKAVVDPHLGFARALA